jgi:hypothetical protein
MHPAGHSPQSWYDRNRRVERRDHNITHEIIRYEVSSDVERGSIYLLNPSGNRMNGNTR